MVLQQLQKQITFKYCRTKEHHTLPPTVETLMLMQMISVPKLYQEMNGKEVTHQYQERTEHTQAATLGSQDLPEIMLTIQAPTSIVPITIALQPVHTSFHFI